MGPAMRVLDEWLLTPWKGAIHLPTATAVVADPHLGYDRARRRKGEAIPVRSMSRELEPLRCGLMEQKIRRLVIAGDLLEDGRHQCRELTEEFRAWLSECGVDIVAVVPGNHDRGLKNATLPVRQEGVELGRWRVVHGDRELPEGKVAQGHEHPCMRWRPGVEGPCFLARKDHLVLPAFSADAAGVNVLRAARWKEYRCFVIAGEQVLDFGEVGKVTRR